MAAPTPWYVALVNELPVPTGGSTYAAHPRCTDSRKAWVYNNERGCGFHCNKCGQGEFTFHGPRSLGVALRASRDSGVVSQTTPVLPSDFTLDIPDDGRVWLLRAGIGKEAGEEFALGWSESLRRVILPVYNGRTLVYWQGRAVDDGHLPKYINPRVSKDTVLYWPEGEPDTSRPCVVCEDILSALRVTLAGHQGCSILGTKLSDYNAASLGKHPRVDIWLDPDRAGQKGRATIRKKLMFFTPVRIIRSDKDPKLYPTSTIQEYLK